MANFNTDIEKSTYLALYEAHKLLVRSLTPGKVLKDVYEIVLSH